MFHCVQHALCTSRRVPLVFAALLAFAAPAHAGNKAPVISGTPPTTATVATRYAFQPTARDPEGRTVTFRIKNKPAWATFSSSTGLLAGTPVAAGTTAYITISASDGRKVASLPSFSIRISPAPTVTNQAPTISGTPPTAVQSGQSYGFRPTAADADGDPLTFSIASKPAWASFDASTGTLSGTPTDANAGTTSGIVISVSDGKVATSLPAFSITVSAPVNHAPTISGTPPTSVQAGQTYAFTPTAADADGDTIAFGIANKPAWASFDVATGRLYGTPAATNAGTTSNIVISVSDGKASATLAPFSLTVVAPVNHAPTISGTPVTSAEVDRPYAFKPAAADADGDALTFSVANKPAWATFDATTGTLYGTPTKANVGTTSNVVVSVSDGKLVASLAPFSITVAAPPTRSVTLNWTPPTMNTDGSALNDLSGYTVSYGNASRQYQTSIRLSGAGTTSVVLEGIEPGTWYFAIKSVNVSGVESDYSGEVSAVL